MKITSSLFTIALSALCLAMSATAMPSDPPIIPPSAFRPTQAGPYLLPDVVGVWNTPGRGYLFDIGRQSIDVYDFAGDLCWHDPVFSGMGTPHDRNQLTYYTHTRRPFEVIFSATPENSTQYHADKIDGLPALCTQAVDRTQPLYIFDAITATFIDYYPFSTERHIDWAQRTKLLRPRAIAARTDAELKNILVDLMAGLEDGHTLISGSADGKAFAIGKGAKPTLKRLEAQADAMGIDFADHFGAWHTQQQDKVFALLDASNRHKKLAGDAVMWGTLDNHIGYLAIESMSGYKKDSDLANDRKLMAQALDQALQDLRHTDALILDVSNNTGGSGEVALDIAARFADQRRFVLTLQVPGAYGISPQPFYVVPGGRYRYSKPVFLLTSDATISGGEWLTMAMRILPQVTQVGQATQGILSGDYAKGLPNGWVLQTSVGVTRDLHGINYEVVGVPPQQIMEVYPSSPTATDREFDQGRVNAVQRLARQVARH